jgi:RHS repeat-associated protein
VPSARRPLMTGSHLGWKRAATLATVLATVMAMVTPTAMAAEVGGYQYPGKLWQGHTPAATASVPGHALAPHTSTVTVTHGTQPLAVDRVQPVTWPLAGTAVASLTRPATALTPSVSVAKAVRADAEAKPESTTSGGGASAAVPVRQVPVSAPVRAGSLPVWVAPVTGQAGKTSGPVSVRVQVASHAQALKAGVDGMLVSLAPVAGASAGPVKVTIDYSAVAQAYGGGFGARLRLVSMPTCVLTTPQLAACRVQHPLAAQNQAGAEQLTGTLALASAPTEASRGTSLSQTKSAVLAAPAASAQTVTALVSSDSGSQGNYGATSLNPSGLWSASGTGAFTYSYPISVPNALGGTAPSVSLDYNSQTADGETSARNAQASWIGESWDYSPGFIEQSFKPCSGDGVAALANSGDECWGGYVATLSFDGHSGQLVPTGVDSSVPGEVQSWKLQDDDGTVVQEMSGAANGLWDGEYFRVETSDGSVAYFGVDHAPDATGAVGNHGDASTNSAWGVPVYSPDSSDPCYSSADGTNSQCLMGHRFNLDFTVSPTKFVQRYDYASETNYYDRGVGQVSASGGTGTLSSYVRGGYLTQISYGYTLADELAGRLPSAEVVFNSAQRCQSSSLVDCAAPLTSANAPYWPDTPYDLNCNSTDSTVLPPGSTSLPAGVCLTGSPTYWSTYRLDSIATYVNVAGTETKVDSYQLTQVYSDAGGTADPVTGMTGVDTKDAGELQAVMWLQSIQHTGWDTTAGGTSSSTLPPITFTGAEIDNRVNDDSPSAPPLYRPRISSILTETGESIAVQYYPAPCTGSPSMSSADDNTSWCYPVYWTPAGDGAPVADWFNKIVVQQVTDSDDTGASQVQQGSAATGYVGSEAQVSSYSYGGPAWHRDDSPLTDDQYRTWDQFRGFRTVTVTTGQAPETLTQSTTTYLQGMDGDYLADGTQRAVTVNATLGGNTNDIVESVTDSNWLAGTPLESDTYTQAGGSIDTETITGPFNSTQTASQRQTAWTSKTPAPATLSTLPDLTARSTTSTESRTYSLLADGSWRENQSVTDLGAEQQVTSVDAIADVTGASPQEQCTTTGYATAPSSNPMMLSFPDQVTTVSGPCAAPTSSTLLSDKRTYYGGDGTLANLGTLGQLDSTGQVTATQTATACTASPCTGSNENWLTTAAMVYDGAGRITRTTIPDPTGAKPAGLVTTTSFTPAWSSSGSNIAPTSSTTVNPQGWATSTTLDPLRGLATASQDPNGRVTTTAYDALGRRIAVWLPGRAQASYPQSPDEKFSYSINGTSTPPTVTTDKLREDDSYSVSATIYDGMLQPRQTQTTPADNSAGRVITDTFYDSHGWPVRTFAPYSDSTTGPDGTMWVANENAVPSETVTDYDGQGRQVESQLYSMATPLWQTDTSYPSAGETDITPPAGGPVTRTLTNALGQTTATVVENTNNPVTLTGGTVIPSGTSLMSDSVRLAMQASGNLVLSSLSSNSTIWSSGTSSTGAHAVFGTDGNLTVYSTSGTKLWASGTATTSGAVLKLNNDSTLAIYPSTSSATATWSEGSAGAAPQGNSTTDYTYTPAGQVSTVSDSAGNTWSYKYNLLGELTSQSDPNAGTSTYSKYDVNGNLLQSTDGRGQQLGYTYDWDNRPTAEYDLTKSATESSSNELASWTYDSLDLGYPTSSTSYNEATSAAYTEAVTGYNTAYQPTGESESVPSSDGFPQTALPSGTTIPSGQTLYLENFSYTANTGLLSNVQYYQDDNLPAENVGYAYDLQGLVNGIGSTLASYLDNTTYTPFGQETGSVYGPYATSSTSPAQVQTTAGYDAATGSLMSTSVGIQNQKIDVDQTSYRYNDVGEPTAISDQESNGTTTTGTDTQCFTYDSLQRLTQAWTDDNATPITGAGTEPAGGFGSCTDSSPVATDTTGTAVTTNVGGPAPYWQSYTYDLLGDRTGMVDHDTTGNSLNDTTQTIGYDGTNGTTPAAQPDQGAVTTTSNPDVGTAVETDSDTDTGYTPNENAGKTMSRKLGSGPLNTGLKNSTGQHICAYDPSGSTTAGTAVTTYACSGVAPQIFTLGTDSTLKVEGMCLDTTGGAKTAGTVVEINTCKSTTTQKWQTGTGNTLVNTAANLCLTDPAASTANSTKLTIAACGATGQSWTTVGATVGQAPGTSQTLTYNPQGLTASAATTNGGASQTSGYTYDASGNLLEQSNSFDSTKILYLFGGTEEITLNVPNKSSTALRYITGPDGTTIVRSSAGTLNYQIPNAQGSGEEAINATTMAVTRRYYDPYGNPRGATPSNWIDPSDNKGFLNQPTDTSSGLDLLGARNYDPTQGRFLSPDPIFETGDPNQMGGYSYAADNPASSSDPTGQNSYRRPTGGGVNILPPSSSQGTDTSGGNTTGTPSTCNMASKFGCDIQNARSIADSNWGSGNIADSLAGGADSVLAPFSWLANAIGSAPGEAVNGVGAPGLSAPTLSAPEDPIAKIFGISPNTDAYKAGYYTAGFLLAPATDGASETVEVLDVIDDIDELVSKIDAGEDALKAATHDVTSSKTGDSGGGKSGKCSFSPDTPVLLADGKTKPIGEIRDGDKVESADPSTGKEEGGRTVQHIWINHDTDLLDVVVSTGHGHTATIHTTANHPFWDNTTHAWVAAGRLKPGHQLDTTSAGQRPTVLATRVTPGAANRYNLTVQQLHTYYVMAGSTPILVHNSCGPDDHVVLGVGKHSDALAQSLRSGGDAGAHTFNDSTYGGVAENGLPEWMNGVMGAAGSTDTRLSVTLDGLPGASPEEAFQNAYIRGVEGGLKGATQDGYGTAWEMSVVGRNAYLNSMDSDFGRPWSSIQFYWGGAPADVAEPNWSVLRGLAGQ